MQCGQARNGWTAQTLGDQSGEDDGPVLVRTYFMIKVKFTKFICIKIIILQLKLFRINVTLTDHVILYLNGPTPVFQQFRTCFPTLKQLN